MSLHQSSGRWRLGLFLSLITVTLWGILAVVLKVILQVLDAYTITWFRFLIAFVLLWVYLATRRQLPDLRQLKPTALGLLAIATLGLAANYVFFLTGLEQTSASNAQILIQLSSVILGLSSLVIFKEHYTRKQWLGLSVMLSGMILFAQQRINHLVDIKENYWLGNTLLVLAAVTWAIYALAQKQLLQKLTSPSIMLCIYGGATLLFSPFASPVKILTISPWHLGLLGFCAVNTLIAYGAFAEALEHWQASRVSAVLALTPLVTLGTGALAVNIYPDLFKSELVSWLGLVGAALVVLGSLTISLGNNFRENEKVL